MLFSLQTKCMSIVSHVASFVQALVRERIKDWGQGMCKRLGKRMVELTGDYTPDLRALLAADIIIVTPEKWDGISRAWQNRGYVQKVALLIIDEIHLLGADRYRPLSFEAHYQALM